MMKLYNKILAFALMFSAVLTVSASDGNIAFEDKSFSDKLTHKIVVGYNLGATAPIPLPREVRSIDSYWPQFTPQLGYAISFEVQPQWHVQAGIQLDLKGMGVQDKVKYMYTDVIMDGNNIQGYFTGKNETKVKLSYVTIPVRLAYDLTPTWQLRAGGYFSYRSSSEFSGTVWDGYLRETDDKDIINSTYIDIPNKGEATFDFGKEMRNFDMGVSVGFEHSLNSRWGLYTDLTYSLTPVFPSNFTGIDMKMRNMYAVVGVSYNITSGIRALTGSKK